MALVECQKVPDVITTNSYPTDVQRQKDNSLNSKSKTSDKLQVSPELLMLAAEARKSIANARGVKRASALNKLVQNINKSTAVIGHSFDSTKTCIGRAVFGRHFQNLAE